VFYGVYYSSCFSGSYLLPSTQHSTTSRSNQTTLTRNPSSGLFTYPALAAHEKMVNMGAKVIMVGP
jgi:hypothetical protein